MSIELLENASAALGGLGDEVVFLGAATIPLWITDPAAPQPRPTVDVDVVVEVTTLREYHQFESRLRAAGFRDQGDMIGRFLFGDENRQLDVIPADASILGFENRWQRVSLPDATWVTLPSGTRIRALAPANLLATKLEAFGSRGNGDFLGSSDFEDIVTLIDGIVELVEDLEDGSADLRSYVASRIRDLLKNDRAVEAVGGHLDFGSEAKGRADAVVLPRLREISRLT